MGRRKLSAVRSAVLRTITLGFDITEQSEGWKASQLARILHQLGVSDKTIRNAVADLVTEGYAEEIPGSGGGYRPTDHGRLALARWEAQKNANKRNIPPEDDSD